MASENETVEEIQDCVRHLADNLPNGVILTIQQCNFIADRIEAAHRREKAELRECLKEAVGFFDRISEGIKVDKGFFDNVQQVARGAGRSERWNQVR